jgi:hypothetical protein
MNLPSQTGNISRPIPAAVNDAASVPTGTAEAAPTAPQPSSEPSRAEVPPGPASGERPVIADNQPARAESGEKPAGAPHGPWARKETPGDDPKAGTNGTRKGYRDAGYVEIMLQSSPLAAGEDGQDYAALVREIHQEVEPKNIFDQMRVADIAHSAWEEGRYRKQRVELPHATRLKAAVVLLMPFTRNFEFKAAQTARDYLCGEPETRERARRIMRHFGISDAAVDAQAAELHAQSIAALDRLIAQSQIRRGTIVKEVERGKRKADKEKLRRERGKRNGSEEPDRGPPH